MAIEERDLMFHPRQYRAIAGVIDRLDVYARCMNLTGHGHPIRLVNKCHLVTRLADLFCLDNNPAFDREAFYDACGLEQEERYLG